MSVFFKPSLCNRCHRVVTLEQLYYLVNEGTGIMHTNCEKPVLAQNSGKVIPMVPPAVEMARDEDLKDTTNK